MIEMKYNVIRRVKGEKAGRVVGIVRGEISAQNTVKRRSEAEIDPRYEYVYSKIGFTGPTNSKTKKPSFRNKYLNYS